MFEGLIFKNFFSNVFFFCVAQPFRNLILEMSNVVDVICSCQLFVAVVKAKILNEAAIKNCEL